ncbi:MAG: C45 family autoproteolytic acyltransferase/hydrolase [Planctomycetota bacterium]
MRRRPGLFLTTLLALAPFVRGQVPPLPAAALHGRLETHDGLRLLRLWGSPAERGYAHGRLLGAEIAAIVREEFSARFADKRPLLTQARGALGRLIEYPEDVAAELDALWQGLVDSGADRAMPKLERDFDRTDLLVANAMDVFGLMGCSSFTVWGEQAVGGGVLTARNFDWPLTGPHMLQQTILVVQHGTYGRAVASVAWPGYVGTVTGVSSDGMAAYLHVGSGVISYTPEPSSWPTAVAARAILAAGAGGGPEKVFAGARELLDYTSPPAGFLTHVVLPTVPEHGRPVAVFETDVEECVLGAAANGPFVVTNHFQTRTDGRSASRDSLGRLEKVQGGIAGCIDVGDHRVDVDEAWQILRSVERGGGRGFGTLHAIVFRHQPFVFELRLATLDERGHIVAAPSSGARHALTRAQVFGEGVDPVGAAAAGKEAR